MSVLTEGNVSSKILSFAVGDYIYTGSVCTSWRKNSPSKCTNILGTLASVSRLDTAVLFGMETIELLDLAMVFGADVDVLRAIGDSSACDTSMMLKYAAFTGNMELIVYLDQPFDEFSLFEAVRGGHLSAVEHMINNGCELNIIPEWPSTFYDDDEFIERCMRMATSAERLDVFEALTTYVTEAHYQCDMGCVELAIRTNRLDILRVLSDGGAIIPPHAFPLAVEVANLDMLSYLESEKATPGDDFVARYMGCDQFDIQTLELLLQKRLVTLDASDLHQAIHTRRKPLTDLLLKHGCAVNDCTINHAVAAWDFSLAGSLMTLHGCRPTTTAYQWLFTGGLCECCVAGFYPLETDDFYLARLDWIYAATGGSIVFESFSDMSSDEAWSVLLTRVTSSIKRWFESHFSSKKQRVA